MEPTLKEVKRAVRSYIKSEGCGCCEGEDHREHQDELGELLGFPRYDDDSGYDFYSEIEL